MRRQSGCQECFHAVIWGVTLQKWVLRVFFCQFSKQLCLFHVLHVCFRFQRPADSHYLITIFRWVRPGNRDVPFSTGEALALVVFLNSTPLLWGLRGRYFVHESSSEHLMSLSNQLWMRAQLCSSVLWVLFETSSLQQAGSLVRETKCSLFQGQHLCPFPPPERGPCKHLCRIYSFLWQL